MCVTWRGVVVIDADGQSKEIVVALKCGAELVELGACG